jgi:hypothetical protein
MYDANKRLTSGTHPMERILMKSCPGISDAQVDALLKLQYPAGVGDDSSEEEETSGEKRRRKKGGKRKEKKTKVHHLLSFHDPNSIMEIVGYLRRKKVDIDECIRELDSILQTKLVSSSEEVSWHFSNLRQLKIGVETYVERLRDTYEGVESIRFCTGTCQRDTRHRESSAQISAGDEPRSYWTQCLVCLATIKLQ